MNSGKPESDQTLSGAEKVMPYGRGHAKEGEVEEMFDSIAPAYDLMNTAMTFGLHRLWRDKALKALLAACGAGRRDLRVLDVATGTGDVAFRIAELFPSPHVTAVDLSEGMLSVARRRLGKMQSRPDILFEKADCLALPFADDSFDAVTVAYGVRNFSHLLEGYREMLRVLRPGGKLCVIELSEPVDVALRMLYRLYSRHIIPAVGKMVSGDSRAYAYLPESIAAAPQRENMTKVMRQAGFREAVFRPLTFGAVTVYMAEK